MTTPDASAASRRRWFALLASILAHVLLAVVAFRARPAFFTAPDARPTPREIVTIVERTTIARKPRPTPPPPPPPAPRPHPVRVPPRARPILPPATAPVARAPVPTRIVAPKHVAYVRHELAKTAPHAPPQAPPAAPDRATQPRLSDARIARIERSLGDAIASDRNGVDPLAVPSSAPAPPKHYGLAADNFLQGERDHHGLCDPVKSWTDGGFDYYFVACNVRFSDGTVQRQAVPWPVRFRPDDDPFNGSSKTGEKPLAMPLPGWRLPEGESITAELREYAHAHGVDL